MTTSFPPSVINLSQGTLPLEPGQEHFSIRNIRFEVVAGPDKGLVRNIPLDQIPIGDSNKPWATKLFIGTQKGALVPLSDPTVSRRHVWFVRSPGCMLLFDNESTNGIFMADYRVDKIQLDQFCRFRVGETELIFYEFNDAVDVKPDETDNFEGMVGSSEPMRRVYAMIKRVCHAPLTALVCGETGTGKELVSRALHNASIRRKRPLEILDCGAVPKDLMESELFGHERGAFTGAMHSRAGIFERAKGGTVLLDEMGELPVDAQCALLRVLESREVRRVGGDRVFPVDFRLVAATNRNLRKEVESGRFREDLYYRLAIVEFHLPALRERMDDLMPLVDYFLASAPFKHRVRGVSPEVARRLMSYAWPGNLRELRNVIFGALPFCEGDTIQMEHLPPNLRDESVGCAAVSLGGERGMDFADFFQLNPDMPYKQMRDHVLESFERRYFTALLDRTGGNLSKAARTAEVDRKTVSRIMKRHGIEVPRGSGGSSRSR